MKPLQERIHDKVFSHRISGGEDGKETLVNRISSMIQCLEYIDKDFYDKYIIAPASTKFHGVYDGGLVDHSVNVVVSLLEWRCAHKDAGLTVEDCILIGLLHDLCKVELYTKNENGKYTYDKELAKHHAKESIRIITKKLNVKLTRQQRVLILLHMSGWQNKEDEKALSFLDRLWLASIKHIKLLQAVNWADMKATQDEIVEELKINQRS